MAHNIIKIIITGLIIVINGSKVAATVNSIHSVNAIQAKGNSSEQPVNAKEPIATPKNRGMAAHEDSPFEKKHKPATEELAHIHHFHKERVKKIKQHHKKYWALSKLLLILCHLALLVIAYQHFTH